MDNCNHNGPGRFISHENYLEWWYCDDCKQNYFRYIECN